jgi:nucleoside-diphosphate-sugar epimerase
MPRSGADGNDNGNAKVNGTNGRANGTARRRRRGHVVVIGGAGYVGSVLIPKLLERQYDVTVLDAFLYGSESLRDDGGGGRLRLVQGDIRNVEAVVRGCHRATAIVHLGGLVGDPSCALDADLTRSINLRATGVIAEVARGLGVPRLLFASSCAVYGASAGLLDEHSPIAPVSMYAQTKAESERVLLAAADATFSPTILRFGTFYGLSPRPRFDLVVNLLTAKAVREQAITIFGGGQWRPFLHVQDGADAIIAALQAPLGVVRGQAFNVGSDEQNHRLGDVAELIRTLVPGVAVDYADAADVEANYHVSFAKIRAELGHTARRTLTDGVLEIKEAVESELIRDYQEARYNNHKSLADGTSVALLGQLASPLGAIAAP